MAVRKVWVFTVEGLYPFPHDMLRYDGAHPYSETDSAMLGAASDGASNRFRKTEEGDPMPPRRHKVTLITDVHAPTDGRWRSFGWTVTNVQERRY